VIFFFFVRDRILKHTGKVVTDLKLARGGLKTSLARVERIHLKFETKKKKKNDEEKKKKKKKKKKKTSRRRKHNVHVGQTESRYHRWQRPQQPTTQTTTPMRSSLTRSKDSAWCGCCFSIIKVIA
jgi:hypothetical protein